MSGAMSCHGDFLGISRRTGSLLKVKNKTHENLETYCNPTNSTNHCQAAHHEAWHMGHGFHGSQWCDLTLLIGKPSDLDVSRIMGPIGLESWWISQRIVSSIVVHKSIWTELNSHKVRPHSKCLFHYVSKPDEPHGRLYLGIYNP